MTLFDQSPRPGQARSAGGSATSCEPLTHTVNSPVIKFRYRKGVKRVTGENPFLIKEGGVIDADRVVRYNGEPMSIKDIPSAQVRALYGLGHLPEAGRDVIPNPTGDPWPYEPENCPQAGEGAGVWINGGQHLVCPGCGLDGT